MRVEMLHDHKSHSRFRRQMAQEFHRCFKSAGRTADSDDRTSFRWFFFVSSAVGAELRLGFARYRSLLSRALLLFVRGHSPLNNGPRLRRPQAAQSTVASSLSDA